MSDRHFPSRVTLLPDNGYCKGVTLDSLCEGRFESGLSGSACERRWNSAWCFCGTVGDGGFSHNAEVSHCHLFGVNALHQLNANNVGSGCGIQQKYFQHVGLDERLNGKMQYSLRSRPQVDGSRTRDSMQLTTVTCSYRIPSSVECLDLAVSRLQRISGCYFINQKTPCVMLLCNCTKCVTDKAQSEQRSGTARRPRHCDSVKKCPRKPPPDCDLLTVCELEREPALTEDSHSNRSPTQRRTRSALKQLVDSSSSVTVSDDSVSKLSGTAADADVKRKDTGDPCVSSMPTADIAHVNKLQVTSANSAKRKASSAAAADSTGAGESCRTDNVSELSLKTVGTGARRLLTKYRRRRQQQKASVHRKQRGYSSGSETGRKLRSHSTSLSSSQQQRPTHNTQRRPRAADGDAVEKSVSSDCEMMLPRRDSYTRQLMKKKITRTQRRLRPRRQHGLCAAGKAAADAAVRCAVTARQSDSQPASHLMKSPTAAAEASQHKKTDDKVSALSVDISFASDDVMAYSSPSSPLPLAGRLKTSDDSELDSSVLQLTARRSVHCSCLFTFHCTVCTVALAPVN